MKIPGRVVLIALSAVCALNSSAFTFNFDDLPIGTNPDSLAWDGLMTVQTRETTYMSFGSDIQTVTQSGDIAAPVSGRALTAGVINPTPLMVGYPPYFDYSYDAYRTSVEIRIDFAHPVTSLDFDAWSCFENGVLTVNSAPMLLPGDWNSDYYHELDSEGNVIGRTPYQHFHFEGSITQVTFFNQTLFNDPYAIALAVDNLQFTMPGAPDPQPVPDSAGISTILMAGASLVAVRRFINSRS